MGFQLNSNFNFNTFVELAFLLMLKNNFVLNTIYIILFLCFLFSCTSKRGELIQPKAYPCGADTLTITYTTFIGSMLVKNCTFSNCHNSGSVFGDYTIYSGIKAKVDNGSFESRVLKIKDMPYVGTPGPTSLDNCTLQKIQTWINHGAPL